MREIRNFSPGLFLTAMNSILVHIKDSRYNAVSITLYGGFFLTWLLAMATRLAMLWLLDLPLSERALRTGAGVVGLTGLCRWLHRELSAWQLPVRPASWVVRWTTLPFWRATHPKAGWVVATGITGKTQRSIESLDVDKGRHAKNQSHGCTSKSEFIRGIWRWLALSYDRFFNARRYFVCGLYNLAY